MAATSDAAATECRDAERQLHAPSVVIMDVMKAAAVLAFVLLVACASERATTSENAAVLATLSHDQAAGLVPPGGRLPSEESCQLAVEAAVPTVGQRSPGASRVRPIPMSSEPSTEESSVAEVGSSGQDGSTARRSSSSSRVTVSYECTRPRQPGRTW